jgi:lipopolysaccharide/colanic/teichoic acid biosynthesis glycosyltransferase
LGSVAAGLRILLLCETFFEKQRRTQKVCRMTEAVADFKLYRDLLKRWADFALAIVVAVFTLPLLLTSSIAILLGDGYPIFFFQTRIGQHGRHFRIAKFRTMSVGAPGTTITVSNDRRITTVGRYLRRWKLDEIPQFWNVLRGDMSFVGPRPDVPGYYDKLKGEDRIVLRLRPGITGAATILYHDEERLLSAQDDPVRYNNEVLFPNKVALNIAYYRNCSAKEDAVLLWRTIFKPER